MELPDNWKDQGDAWLIPRPDEVEEVHFGGTLPVGLDVLAHDGLDRGGDEEVLLAQAQALALIVVVLGVEHDDHRRV
mgnify:CR=1 FL=1